MIATLKLPSGSLGSKTARTALAGIGHTHLHEAIRKLSAAHLKKIVSLHGGLVAEVIAAEQVLVLELRGPLERLG